MNFDLYGATTCQESQGNMFMIFPPENLLFDNHFHGSYMQNNIYYCDMSYPYQQKPFVGPMMVGYSEARDSHNVQLLNKSQDREKQALASPILGEKFPSFQNQRKERSSEKECENISSKEKNQTGKNKRKCETKNLIKNYGRSMLAFITKATKLRKRLLKKLKIEEAEFMEAVSQFKVEIHTIAELKYLWNNHPFSKAFRILCCEYLRKHNLHHVFNSRIYKYDVYLKYQNKMMRSMESPKEFESLKEYGQ